ncbi:2-oxo-4-hydroxy-4-carboxy-5-ureidoimidazoline decarboxylase [Comamonas sp.]|nr:2-oxo-4-hydroxy-4-carboxy-5-ureidoimidazoline decarboxylase [Comamonas sp.]MPT12496.1 2-oxo-4-hydroxy-4-carboxy-5-ureidoimidazoline decarboxylase [Comamonas sp.]
MALTLEQLNAADAATATDLLDGLYEHSPWIAAKALEQRPFKSMAHIKHAMAKVLAESSEQSQLDLIRAHPELAGKQMETNTLTAESTNEQKKAGLTNCTPEELEHIRKLNAEYGKRFGFPFILAVRGARGLGLSKAEIIATFERRMFNHPAYEQAEALRNIHRIAEIRLNDKFGYEPVEGNEVWDWQERLSTNSDPGYAEKGQLTVTYLTDAHRACAQRISHWMREIGFDEVEIDAVGNVVGRYKAAPEFADKGAKTLLTGSHYDTVRNGGKYDGRLGIFVPMACVKQLAQQGKRLPFNIEVVGFSEEEGQRYKATFLGSGALVGDFKQEWLEQKDADGITLREAMLHAGLCIDDIPKLERDPAKYLGFVEVHIEQGPVLNELDIPLGIVTSINGSARYVCEFIGMASHAGTTPMDRRRDAAAGVAELSLYIEKRAGQDGDSVATIGQLNVPSGSVNVVPGRCQFSLDLRAPTNEQRDAMINDIMAEMAAIAERRGLRYTTDLSMKAAAAPSAPEWQKRWENAVDALGVPLFRMPSGAGHDAMKLHEIMPQAMLFVRGMNAGISHNPLEASTSDDMQLSVDAFTHLLHQLAQEQQ